MRRKSILQDMDLSTWPTVAYAALSGSEKSVFQVRRQALERYAQGESILLIEQATGINRRQLYRMLNRCLSTHADGRIYGFRALASYKRIASYVRITAPKVQGKGGGVGALEHLLERYPTLVTWLTQQIKRRVVVLDQTGTDVRLRTRLRGLARLHTEFLKQCRALGVTAIDYPFNTDSLGIRSLSERVKAEILRTFAHAARAAGASHLKGMPRHKDIFDAPAVTYPYQVVEFDGHRLDIRLKVEVRDPLGFDHAFEVERVWLLVIIDICTRAVLGYHLVLASEYSRYDVIKTIEKALEPHSIYSFTLPGLGYGPHGGFPTQHLPELAYATWEWMRLDNAKANLAQETLSALCEFVGCFTDAGPAYSPDERPYIERLFGSLANTMSSRLPGYTGSHPRDMRRALADPKGSLRLLVSLGELDELVESAIGSYNGMPHGGLNGRTPLEAMTHFIRDKQPPMQWLAEPQRRTMCLMQTAQKCTVRAYLNLGARPHINLHGVRYTSALLAASTSLIGAKLLIYLNADDMRTVRAFLPDGAELGVLTAQGAWGVVAHNLKLRQEIVKLRGSKRIRAAVDQNLIEDYIQTKLSEAKKSRKSATELSSALRMLASAPTHRTPPGLTRMPAESSDAVSSVREVNSPEKPAAKPAQPETLSIGTGHAF